jgi:hypothetical protein
MRRFVVLLASFGWVLLAQCSNTPDPCGCTEGTTTCANGVLSVCQVKDGCLQPVESTPCASNACQDPTSCMPPANCGSFLSCDTCAMNQCFWCTDGFCTGSADSITGQAQGCNMFTVSGPTSATVCAQLGQCGPNCAYEQNSILCPNGFVCSCVGGTPVDTNCTTTDNIDYCCN